jgi:hypothetical protein
MNALTFDTLKLARRLEAAGFSPEQAAGASAALAETLSEVPGVATKEDVLGLDSKGEANVLRIESKIEVNALRLESKIEVDVLRLEAKIEATKAGLEAKIEATKAEIIRWMSGTIGFQTIIILGAVVALATAPVK